MAPLFSGRCFRLVSDTIWAMLVVKLRILGWTFRAVVDFLSGQNAPSWPHDPVPVPTATLSLHCRNNDILPRLMSQARTELA
jgi:hypothetical protein